MLVICSEEIEPMSLVRCYPIGVMYMRDNGDMDEKIIAIPYNDPTYNYYTDIEQLPEHIFEEIQHFFSVYKDLENRKQTSRTLVVRQKQLRLLKNVLLTMRKNTTIKSNETMKWFIMR